MPFIDIGALEEKLRKLRDAGKTILIASHDRMVIQSVADHVYHVNEGEVTA
ncbi:MULTISPECIES: hypothetical protein [Pediococcus]|uniref:hypothetical protein n=1 Tax=Pediococcus TaxID=1253 RepID=UPI0021A886D4|nr:MULTISPECIES: hypothetical protein [Pediococcus]